MNSAQTMIVPLGIKANFNEARRIAHLIGRLPTADSDFRKMKGPTVWTITGIAAPGNPKKMGKFVVDKKSGLCFMPHGDYHDMLERFLSRNAGKRPVFLFENLYGDGWTPEPAVKGRILSPDNTSLTVFGIGSWKMLPENNIMVVSYENPSSPEIRVSLKQGVLPGESNFVAPLAVDTSFSPAIYARASHPDDMHDVAVEITLEKLAEGVGKNVEALKKVLSDDLYFATLALTSAVKQLFQGSG